jgi:hypothetical protein
MKTAAFWDRAPCRLVEVNRRFRSAYCLYHKDDEDGGSMHLRNVGLLQRDYTALYPRNVSSSKLKLTGGEARMEKINRKCHV